MLPVLIVELHESIVILEPSDQERQNRCPFAERQTIAHSARGTVVHFLGKSLPIFLQNGELTATLLGETAAQLQ